MAGEVPNRAVREDQGSPGNLAHQEDFITLESVLTRFPDGPISNWEAQLLWELGLDPQKYTLRKNYNWLGWHIMRCDET